MVMAKIILKASYGGVALYVSATPKFQLRPLVSHATRRHRTLGAFGSPLSMSTHREGNGQSRSISSAAASRKTLILCMYCISFRRAARTSTPGNASPVISS